MGVSAAGSATGSPPIGGVVRVDRRTKNLIPRLQPGDIAVICHRDLDTVAAEGLRDARVMMVINAEATMSGRYPTQGPRVLLSAGIPVLDQVGPAVMSLSDGERISVRGTDVYADRRWLGRGTWLTMSAYERLLQASMANLGRELRRFVDNTLDHAAREKDLLLGDLHLPTLNTPMAGRHVLVVVRGRGFREDLQAVAPYVREVRPVLIGVDGGADALWEFGFRPDLIVGDMDSVSDQVLRCGAEIVVHAYPDGRAPGLARVQALGLSAKIASLPGTSEDLALLLASEAGADLLVAVGTHTDAIDFFEKGRAGMASTFLTRLRVGQRLVDAKGVSQLYRARPAGHHSAAVIAAAFVPLIVVILVSDGLRVWIKLLWLQARLWLGL